MPNTNIKRPSRSIPPPPMRRRGWPIFTCVGAAFPRAEAELRKLVSAHQDQLAARIQLGRVLGAEGKGDEAIAELQAAAKLAPSDVFAAARSRRSVRHRQEIRSGRGGVSGVAGRESQRRCTAPRHWERRCSKKRNSPTPQKEFLVAVKTQTRSGDGFTATCLRRRREQGLSPDHQGFGRPCEIPAGRGPITYFCGLRPTTISRTLSGRQ